MKASPADVYTDFSGLARLRAQAREGTADAPRQVASQVEALFVGMMLKSMREAGAAFGGSAGGVHQGMYDSQLALSLAKGGRLGFADTVLAQIAPGTAPEAQRGFPAPARNPALPARDWAAVRTAAATGRAAAVEQPAGTGAAGAPGAAPDAGWDTPEDFARALWPAASRAARALGTRPEAVVAVAALETGWGRHMPRRADGSPSYNLFGIKAHGWGGEVARSATLEFEHGSFTRRVEPFRAYGSPEASVEDFARFVAGQPRYREALESGGDPVRFVRALERAGYATDPRYAEKLEELVNSAPLKRAALAAETVIT